MTSITVTIDIAATTAPTDGASSGPPPLPMGAAKSAPSDGRADGDHQGRLPGVPLSPQHQEQLQRGRTVHTTLANLSYVCEWMPTHLHLPARGANGTVRTRQARLRADDPRCLCLPMRLFETSYFKRGGEEEEERKDDDHWHEATARLRRAELERYLRSVAPLLGARNDGVREEDAGGPPRNRRRTKYERRTAQHRRITAENSGRVLHVHQGEIAHCTPRQADVLVSDDATTCHIVALWSRSGGGGPGEDGRGGGRVLATMTHIDGPGYGASVRDAFEEHVRYHTLAAKQEAPPQPTPADENGEECKENYGDAYPEHPLRDDVIDLSVHIVGGFDDAAGTSVEITDSLLRTLAMLARDGHERHDGPRVRTTLATCAAAAANDDGAGGPRGRGLGLAVATGEAFLAEVEEGASADVAARGPAEALRGARLWAAALHGPVATLRRRLHVIHRPDSDRLRVDPYFFGPHAAARGLLECTDDELLDVASTSPSVEKPCFVRQVRESLEYMNGTESRQVFPENQPVEYERVGLNGWVRV